MGLLWGLVLGVIQGATEFLPVSSSAHLAFAGALAGISEKDALPFFLVLHFGTLAALAAYFAGDLLGLAKGCLRLDRTAWRLVLMIALTSLPTGIIGLALKDIVEKAFVSTALARRIPCSYRGGPVLHEIRKQRRIRPGRDLSSFGAPDRPGPGIGRSSGHFQVRLDDSSRPSLRIKKGRRVPLFFPLFDPCHRRRFPSGHEGDR